MVGVKCGFRPPAWKNLNAMSEPGNMHFQEALPLCLGEPGNAPPRQQATFFFLFSEKRAIMILENT